MEFPAVCVPMYLCQNELSEYGPGTPNPKSVKEVLHEELEKVEVDKPNVDNINWVSNLEESLNLKGKPHHAVFNLIPEDRCGYVSRDLPLACDPSVHDLDFNIYGCRSYLVNSDGHELELDFKRYWKGFRSSTSEKVLTDTLYSRSTWMIGIDISEETPGMTSFLC
ncbi:unnamed protein product [Fraxinus pennsylvanica]|uniref:Uncharacterized protein n=1 Tax=Fraxinus pennsylvanica TaxID=56036 RepID=A0AAD2A0T0_9LAMI|nr:unnamed protein product [Fraxinus pennsylvanica]